MIESWNKRTVQPRTEGPGTHGSLTSSPMTAISVLSLAPWAEDMVVGVRVVGAGRTRGVMT